MNIVSKLSAHSFTCTKKKKKKRGENRWRRKITIRDIIDKIDRKELRKRIQKRRKNIKGKKDKLLKRREKILIKLMMLDFLI